MKSFCERTVNSRYSCNTSGDSPNTIQGSSPLEPGSSNNKPGKSYSWSGVFTSAFSIFETHGESKSCGKKVISTRSNNGWSAAVRRAMNIGSMRRLQERVLGFNKNSISLTTSEIWLLGVCYKILLEDSSGDPAGSDGFAAFVEDFSSRILMTYRKGFAPIGDSKYTSDVNWGCMVRSSQMLVAQALIVHQFGRSWRKPCHKPFDEDYVWILHLFGDAEASTFSIHNLLQAGKAYDLAAGSWVGPYAMCRTWETLVRSNREDAELDHQSLPMEIYVVSGDEDGERGGAPVVCVEDANRHCFEFSKGQAHWTPLLLMVPLVLGLDKINPRYIPLLGRTFTFPQSLGLLGGRPGASTYVVGLQDDKAFYLDPHEVQPAVDIRKDDLEADTSSYHCNSVRHIPLDALDPSLAIGFYCRDKDDFDDFCNRASKLAEESNGAPLFTVTQTRNSPKPSTTCQHDDENMMSGGVQEDGGMFDAEPTPSTAEGGFTTIQEDDWQLL